MKNVAVFLFSTVTVASAFAGSRSCSDVELAINSHPSVACPAATEICVKDLDTANKTAKSIVLKNGQKKTVELAFVGYSQKNDSDVAAHLIYSFAENDMLASYEVASDKEYPFPTETGGFESLTLFTGKTSSDKSVNTSQYCSYDVVKE